MLFVVQQDLRRDLRSKVAMTVLPSRNFHVTYAPRLRSEVGRFQFSRPHSIELKHVLLLDLDIDNSVVIDEACAATRGERSSRVMSSKSPAKKRNGSSADTLAWLGRWHRTGQAG
jgi:hypothetical protein